MTDEMHLQMMKIFRAKTYTSVAIDEGTTKKRKHLDFVLENAYDGDLKSYPASVKSMNALTATEYVIAISAGLIEITRYEINISSIVKSAALSY
jgi:plasmid rolling circle replication initiator protein Rep